MQGRRTSSNTQADNNKHKNNKYVFFRHKIVYILLKPLFRLYLKIKYNYHADKFRPDKMSGPYFILASHTGALDPFMLALSFNEPIYFVASDHIFRLGLVSRVICWLVAPIPIVKSQIDLQAMRQIVSISREGGSVCLFPSGNRSFTGAELPIPDATGKLIRHMKCNVIFYRFEGGYLTSPRWGRHNRRGTLSGRVVKAMSAQEAAAMSPADLNRLASELLQADPYQNNIPAKVSFRGRKLAEHLERVLFICPACTGISTLKSSGNNITCTSCGFSAEYLENGWLKGSDISSQQIIDRLPHTSAFDKFQQNWLDKLLSNPAKRIAYSSDALFCDLDERLIRTSRAKHNNPMISGTLRLMSDRLEIENSAGKKMSFAICDMGRLSVHGPQVLQFYDSCSDAVYELKSDKPRSAYKYLVAIDMLKKYCNETKEEVV